MRAGIISCSPETDLMTVARTMADNHVHSVVVDGDAPHRWGLITALDLAAASLVGADAPEARVLASSEIVTVAPSESLERAVQLMTEHQLSHLIVVSDGRPVGVVSTLDVAGYLARERT